MKYTAEIEEAVKKLKEYAAELRKLKRYKKRRKLFQRASKEKLKRLAPHFVMYLVSGDERHLEKLKSLEKLYEDFKDVIVEDDELLYALALLHQLRELRASLQQKVRRGGATDKIATIAKLSEGGG